MRLIFLLVVPLCLFAQLGRYYIQYNDFQSLWDDYVNEYLGDFSSGHYNSVAQTYYSFFEFSNSGDCDLDLPAYQFIADCPSDKLSVSAIQPDTAMASYNTFLYGAPVGYLKGRRMYPDKVQIKSDPYGFDDYNFIYDGSSYDYDYAKYLRQGWYELGGAIGVGNRASKHIFDSTEKIKKIIDDVNQSKDEDPNWRCKDEYTAQTPYAVRTAYTDYYGVTRYWYCVDLNAKNRGECLLKHPSNKSDYFACLNPKNQTDAVGRVIVMNRDLNDDINKSLVDLSNHIKTKSKSLNRDLSDLNDTANNLKSLLSQFSSDNNITVIGGFGDSGSDVNAGFDDSRIVGRLDNLIKVNTAGFSSLNATVAGAGGDGNSSGAGFGVLDFAKQAGLDGNITSSGTSAKLTNIIENSLKSAVDDDFITKVLSSFSFGIRDIFKPLEAVAYWTDISANLKGLNTTVSITYQSFSSAIGILKILVAFLFGILSIVHIFTRIFD